jgi:hypothetical protein
MNMWMNRVAIAATFGAALSSAHARDLVSTHLLSTRETSSTEATDLLRHEDAVVAVVAITPLSVDAIDAIDPLALGGLGASSEALNLDRFANDRNPVDELQRLQTAGETDGLRTSGDQQRSAREFASLLVRQMLDAQHWSVTPSGGIRLDLRVDARVDARVEARVDARVAPTDGLRAVRVNASLTTMPLYLPTSFESSMQLGGDIDFGYSMFDSVELAAPMASIPGPSALSLLAVAVLMRRSKRSRGTVG